MAAASTIFYYRARRGRLLLALGDVCELCGSKDRLEVHHKIKCGFDHDGGWHRLIHLEAMLREGRREELQLVCFDCHSQIEPHVGRGGCAELMAQSGGLEP